MKLIAGTVLASMLFAGSAFADFESFGKLNPQVILLSDPPIKCAWYSGITLSDLLIKRGGTSEDYVSIVRNGVAEKIKIEKNFNRVLEPWDIVVLGYQPGLSPTPQPAASRAASPKS